MHEHGGGGAQGLSDGAVEALMGSLIEAGDSGGSVSGSRGNKIKSHAIRRIKQYVWDPKTSNLDPEGYETLLVDLPRPVLEVLAKIAYERDKAVDEVLAEMLSELVNDPEAMPIWLLRVGLPK